MKAPSDYDTDTRNNACNSLVDALLSICDTQAAKVRLGVALLGYDPQE